ncbi:Smad nuclear-interacting protein 1 [Capsicum baccatum]|uniref:Smad nuclear-interacting protein 1 n=1 Tax=Capsicum baccatum TaxID=33114 RepID=A0A2G2VR20_CAPBA|nr:Smad nuclear-interacting protein 1 [Capsicum baccatum]
MGRIDSRSPARVRGSPRRRSPSRRERSPAHKRSSHAASSAVAEKPSRCARSRSPVPLSPARERPSSRNRSPKRRKSFSPASHSPIREKPTSCVRSPKRANSRSPDLKLLQGEKFSGRARSPRRAKLQSPEPRSPSSRTKRLRRAERDAEEKSREREPEKNHGRSSDRATHREKDSDRMLPEPRSPSPLTKRLKRAERDAEEKLREREPEKNHGRSSDRAKHREKDSDRMLPESRSPSPRTKRLRRAEREAEEKSREREPGKNHGRSSDRATLRENDSDRVMQSERRERKSGKDSIDNGSYKSRNGRSASPSERQHRSRHRSRSPAAADNRAHPEATNSRRGEHRNGEDDSLSKMKEAEEALEAKNKDKPSFELSGKLAAETNRVRGITLLFNEPPDARKPDIRWRLYVFKGGEVLNEPLYVHRQSCYLFGRERRVADIPTDHPSCSKQHAVLQYRQVEKDNPDGTSSKQVRPYVMDLGSTNGTFINDNRIEPERYYELFEKDTLKFGNSSREYVLLHENSAG